MTLDTYAKKMNPPSIVLGGVHGKVCWLIAYGDTAPLNANPIADLVPNCNLTFQSVTVDNVSRIIDSLKPKTSSCVYCISNKLIKYVKKCHYGTAHCNY